MKVLLTGASGFIGQELIQQRKADYICPLRKSLGVPNEVYIADINQDTSWVSSLAGCEAVIHLAGVAHSKHKNLDEIHRVNVAGTLKLAWDAVECGVKRFVFVSSIGVNGAKTLQSPFSVSSKPTPHNIYSKTKFEAELGLARIAEETGLEVVIVRPTLVYGPDAPGNFGLLTRLIKHFPILPFGLADNRRDFIAVQNLADLLFTCARHPKAAGHIFLACDGNRISIKGFTNAIAQGLGKNRLQLPIPISLIHLIGHVVGKTKMIEQLIENLEVDSSNIKDVLGWEPPYSMEQAMLSLRLERNK